MNVGTVIKYESGIGDLRGGGQINIAANAESSNALEISAKYVTAFSLLPAHSQVIPGGDSVLLRARRTNQPSPHHSHLYMDAHCRNVCRVFNANSKCYLGLESCGDVQQLRIVHRLHLPAASTQTLARHYPFKHMSSSHIMCCLCSDEIFIKEHKC